MRRPLIGARDFEASIGQGKQAQGVMEAHQGRGHGVYAKKARRRRRRRRRNVRKFGY
jgi:hypothetical protein